MTREELVELFAGLGAPAYRADQLLHGLYHQRITRLEELTTFPKALRQELERRYPPIRATIAAREAAPDGTIKLLLELADGKRVETVAIPSGDRVTACVSSQAGCALGCTFCATARMGLVRNLRAGEVIEQFLALTDALHKRAERGLRPITNVVFMGMGEPLANLPEVLGAVRLLNAPWGFGLRKRGIRISTVGLVPQIDRLAREEPQVGLTISLNAPRDELRDRLMPINRTYPIARLLEAADRFTAKTGRMVTFGYVIIPRVNDTEREAHELVSLFRGRPVKLNLIPFNPYPGFRLPEESAPPEAIDRDAYFEGRHPLVEYLQERLPYVSFRRSRGLPIRAACGQLYLRNEAAPDAADRDAASSR
jgi:23S rRNA (adenine2503-C2)-methyltransferase